MIIECVGTQAYRLGLPKTMRIHPVFHVMLLESYKQSDIPGRTCPPPPPVRIEGEIEYEVEAVLNSKIDKCNGVLQYLIRWKGCPDTDNTWEPASNVKNAAKLVEQFHKRYPHKP